MTHTTPGTPGPTHLTQGRSDAAQARDKAKEAAQRQGERLAEDIRATADDAGRVATAKAEETRDRAADEFERTARAFETAAGDLDDGSVQRELLRRAAGGLHEISSSVRGKNLGEMVEELARFGRRNPALFLGGAALTGFALARFGRADAPPDTGRAPARPIPSGPTASPATSAATPGPRTEPLPGSHTDV